jgi:hypothetical protein
MGVAPVGSATLYAMKVVSSVVAVLLSSMVTKPASSTLR